MRRMFGEAGGKDYQRPQPFDDDQDGYSSSFSDSENRPRPAALDVERPRSAWASGSAHDYGTENSQFHDIPIDGQHGSGSWGGERSGPLKPAPVSAPPFQVVASQGYGHSDHVSQWGQPYPSPQQQHPGPSPYAPQPASPPRGPVPPIFVGPKKKRFAWLLPMVVVMACIVVFIVEMYVNNCPANLNRGGIGERQECVMGFLGRLSFQPLSENPLFGPSTEALLNTGALESNRVTVSGEGWRLITCMWLHAGVIHLVSNMLGIWFIGVPLEREFGALRVGTIYMLSGFAGSLLSALFLTNQISVGASGALFGLIGASLSELIINWERYANRIAALVTLILVICVNLVLGLMPYVDNFAHIGGLVAGILLGFVLLVKPRWEWEQLAEGRIEDSPPLPGSRGRRNSPCQNITRIVAAILLVAGYVVAIVILFTGVDANKKCGWCHYLSCVPTSAWECPTSSNSGRPVVCRAISNSDGSGSMVCANQRSTPVPNIGRLSDSELRALCTRICG